MGPGGAGRGGPRADAAERSVPAALWLCLGGRVRLRPPPRLLCLPGKNEGKLTHSSTAQDDLIFSCWVSVFMCDLTDGSLMLRLEVIQSLKM